MCILTHPRFCFSSFHLHLIALYRHSFRNTVVSGSFTLPVMFLLTAVCWMLPDVSSLERWGGLALTAVTAYLLMEMNTRFSLLRVRSRLVSTSFLFLMLIHPSLQTLDVQMLQPLCLVLGYFMLFSTYQQYRSEGYVFHAFLFLGIGSLFFPFILFLIPVYWIGMLFFLRSFTFRSLVAGLLGLLMPYWFYVAYAVWENRLDSLPAALLSHFSFRLPDFELLTTGEMVSGAVLTFFSLCALVHLFHTAYNDKIKTRMLFYTVVTAQILLCIALWLIPSEFITIFRLFIVNSAILMAHYYATGNGRFFDAWFNVSLLLLVALGIYQHFL